MEALDSLILSSREKRALYFFMFFLISWGYKTNICICFFLNVQISHKIPEECFKASVESAKSTKFKLKYLFLCSHRNLCSTQQAGRPWSPEQLAEPLHWLFVEDLALEVPDPEGIVHLMSPPADSRCHIAPSGIPLHICQGYFMQDLNYQYLLQWGNQF